VYGTRDRSEPAIAGSTGELAGAYPVNFGSPVTGTAAAAAAAVDAGASGRWAWIPPTSMVVGEVVVGS
jgi:hypothetical protein